jgi:hypothetical protein
MSSYDTSVVNEDTIQARLRAMRRRRVLAHGPLLLLMLFVAARWVCSAVSLTLCVLVTDVAWNVTTFAVGVLAVAAFCAGNDARVPAMQPPISHGATLQKRLRPQVLALWIAVA